MSSAIIPRVFVLELSGQTLNFAAFGCDGPVKYIEQLDSCWLGESAGLETALRRLLAEAETGPAVVLLRPAGGAGAVLGDAVKIPDWAAGHGDGATAHWAWACPTGEAGPGVVDLIPGAAMRDFLDRIDDCGVTPVRCQSAWLSRLGLIARALGPEAAGVVCCDLHEDRVEIVCFTADGDIRHATAPMGLDRLVDRIQQELGLKFRGSANRLFHGGSYDFSDVAGAVVAPLAEVIRSALPEAGAQTRGHLVLGGLTDSQSWVGAELARQLEKPVCDIDEAVRLCLRKGGVAWKGDTPARLAGQWGVLGAILDFDVRQPGAASTGWHALVRGAPVACGPLPGLEGAAMEAAAQVETSGRVKAAPVVQNTSARSGPVRHLWTRWLCVSVGLILIGVLAWGALNRGQAVEDTNQQGRPEVTRMMATEGSSETGGLVLVARPEGAMVVLGERAPIKAPVRFTGLPQGRHQVTVLSPGYETELREVVIRAGEVVDVGVIMLRRHAGEVVLESLPDRLPFELIPLESIPDGRVLAGRTPAKLERVVAGAYTLVVRRDGAREFKRDIKVEHGTHQRFDVDLRGLEPGGAATVRQVAPDRVLVEWRLPKGDYREIEVFMNTSEDTVGRRRVGKAEPSDQAFSYSLPADLVRGSTYWFWVKVMLTNGNHGNVGPVSVVIE